MSTKRSWCWDQPQQESFEQVKLELTRPMVLALYNPNTPTKISADASAYGLGAVLLQEAVSAWRPVIYASRSLSDTERRYAQIEKEALAVTWACSKFANYILGRPFLIETDHKPLVPILSTKHLDDIPPRCSQVSSQACQVQLHHHAYTRQIAVYCRHLVMRTSTNRRPRSP